MLQSLNIPAIGEGLQEARVVAFLKQPGDTIKRDEVIYQMETDKAVMDVESPFEGVLTEWLAKVDDVLPIGAEVGRLEVGGVAVAAPAVVAAPVSAPAASNFVDLTIPAIGEGLQEARLVAVLKQPGDAIKRDDIIYQMETDKAVMDVECPYEGVLVEWLAPVDTVLAIGAPVGRMTVSGAVPAGTPVSAAPVVAAAVSAPAAGSDSSGRRLDIPPRTRAYAKEKGISAADLEKISAAGSKLMPEDVDRFLAGSAPAVAPAPAATPVVSDKFVETAVAGKQRILNSRMVRGNQLVVPGTIMVAVRWDAIETRRASYKTAGGDFQPSSFTMFSFAVAQALKSFPGFRTTILGDDKYRTYNHANLGIAVSLPGDELVLAVVDDSDTFGWVQFAGRMREQIDIARGGKDQANESVTISLTNMQSFGLRDAVPVVVPPSVATLFLGEVYKGLDQNSDDLKMVKYANLALTFDHRVINGVGAAAFIKAVKELVENIDTTLAL
ncbi:MAG: 2-oxo acid dehydrogenase subunit E2 [Armatimonadetes bacterium]|nr:2-oxo acid dehydrogenase subunit E2 [Armatimonadota bacterium]